MTPNTYVLKLTLIVVIVLFYPFYGKFSFSIRNLFRRRHNDGTLVDRESKDYDADIRLPFNNYIAYGDKVSASIQLQPNPVNHGGKVKIKWKGVTNPQGKDFIAHYCPFYDNPSHYLDFFYVTESWHKDSWQNGTGEHTLVVYNMRSDCVFKYYRAGSHYSQLVAESEHLKFVNGHTEPLQGHLSLTNDPTQMRVMWTSGEVNEPAVVKYGVDRSLKNEEYEIIVRTYTADQLCQAPANSTGFWHPGFIFDALLVNLQPKTLYYYSYGTRNQMSSIFNFTTPLPSGDSTPYKMIIYGDMGTDPAPQGIKTGELIPEEIQKNDVKFVLHHGDISYARGYAYIWEQWFDIIEPYSTLIPYFVGIGNHEQDHLDGGEGRDMSGVTSPGSFHPAWFNGGNDSGGECGVAMYNRFHMPDNGNKVWWYSFDYGLAHYIMLSTEHDYSPNSPQYEWLENDLKNIDRTLTPWVIVAGHRAMYCSQKIQGDYIVSVNMQRLFEDLLYKYHVDLAFWAHYHSYERTCKVYKGKCQDDGILHIVVGSAGKSVDNEGWMKKEWSLFQRAAYGYGRVTVANSSALLYEWIENDVDTVMDHVWLTK